MNEKPSSFTFVGYEDDVQQGSVTFSYELLINNERYCFNERLGFRSPSLYDKNSCRSVLESLFLLLGISYWKLYCPRKIVIRPFSLSLEQADFWNTVYTKGLGEFYYQNKIDFRGLVQFPYSNQSRSTRESTRTSDRSLVLMGGGKDSIVTAELLKKQKKEFSLFTLNPVPLQQRIAATVDANLVEFRRTLDPQLFHLNKTGSYYNGHVPITAIYSFMGLLASMLYGYGFVVASNERSANYGNVSYLGQEINHQWSKSFEFEELLRDYIRRYITSDVTYFSLLRPIHEVAIVKLFSEYDRYFSLFSSCNRNFTISPSSDSTLWCGQCPKCAFVFLLLSAFLPKETVQKIFKKNLFGDASLVGTYKELLGLEGFKPFECVGTPEESLWAFYQVLKRGEYNSDIVVQTLSKAVSEHGEEIKTFERTIFDISKKHAIPKEFTNSIPTL